MDDYEFVLTIAIPTHNGAKTIEQMLDILLPQVTSEIEVIISDNASTDNTPTIIQDYLTRFPHVVYNRIDKNIGPDANYLKCMRMARGKFTYLLSDDDVLIEGAIEKIISYLKQYPDVSLVYLDSVGFEERYEGESRCHKYREKVCEVKKDLYTSDRVVFMNHAIRMWGFLSSFLWSTSKFHNIVNAEAFYNTNWLQSYIHIGCVREKDDKLGVIKGPCVAAGEYRGVNSFCTAEVDGVKYKKMLDYAVNEGFFDRKQLTRFFVWRICYLGRVAIIREREYGLRITNLRKLFTVTYRFPRAWISLYPFFVVPQWAIELRKRILAKKSDLVMKRTEE